MAIIKITGKLVYVSPIKKLENFEKRTIWVDECAEQYNNVWEFELWKADVNMIENYSIGDTLTFSVDVKGRKYYSSKYQSDAIINTLKCWNITKDGKSFKEEMPQENPKQSNHLKQTGWDLLTNNDRCF